MVEHQAAVIILLAGEETVVGDIQRGEPLLTELVARRALRRQDQDNIVVGCIHAVEVAEVQAGFGVEERVSPDLEAVAAIRGVLRGLASVELCVAAEENALQLAADG